MAWYVETLIRNTDTIKDRINGPPFRTGLEQGYFMDFDDNDYNNLLILEKAIKTLRESGGLTPTELSVIDMASTGVSMQTISDKMDMSRVRVIHIMKAACNKLARVLKDEFTNEGYLSYLKSKYHLNDAQLEKARAFMSSTRNN